MSKIYLPMAVVTLMFVGLVGYDYEPRAVGDADPARVAEMKQALRDLWVGRIFWVRLVVLNNATNNAEERDAAEKEVVANAQQIASTIAPFYGEAVSQKFLSLLDLNYDAVRAYLEATVAGDKREQDATIARLDSNADDIADFLSHLNPYLQTDNVRGPDRGAFSRPYSPNQPVQGKGICAPMGNLADDATTCLCHCGYVDGGVGEAVSEPILMNGECRRRHAFASCVRAAITMGGIVHNGGLTVEQFRELL